jgi:rubrerythrin
MKASKNFPAVSPEEFAKARDTLHKKSNTKIKCLDCGTEWDGKTCCPVCKPQQ